VAIRCCVDNVPAFLRAGKSAPSNVFLETQIELVAKIGVELYAQRHIGELGED
jgi:hypothetical protein